MFRFVTSNTFSAHETHRLQALDGTRLATFWPRALALLIDLVLINVLTAGASLAWSVLASPSGHRRIKMVDDHTWWVLVVIVVYFGIATYLGNGATPGKRLLRIRVVSLTHDRISLWQCVERALGYAASSLEAGFGFFQYFIHPNRQTVHDRIAETIVVSERPRRDGVLAESTTGASETATR